MIEIERKFLLDTLPSIPGDAEVRRIEQGYLGRDDAADAALTEGRIRRAVNADGSIVCTHTVKTGSGLVRRETEREITESDFERAWPHTAGRRLRKTRHRVTDGGLTWEIDAFDDLDLVLAEVELPDSRTEAIVPPWLEPHVVRDVTDEPEYRNYELASKIGRGDG